MRAHSVPFLPCLIFQTIDLFFKKSEEIQKTIRVDLIEIQRTCAGNKKKEACEFFIRDFTSYVTKFYPLFMFH
jgi:hypothetical protein